MNTNKNSTKNEALQEDKKILNLVECFSFTKEEIYNITINTVKAGFLDINKRNKLLERIK